MINVRTMLAAIALGGLSVMALMVSPPAKADTTGFLAELQTATGGSFYDTTLAIVRGHQICDALDNGMDVNQVAQNFYRNSNSDVPTLWEAQEWVIAAGDQLCPWHSITRDENDDAQKI